MAVDEAKLNEFLHRFVGDLGATVHAANVVIGDKLGLYKALAAAGPSTPAELAERSDSHPRYVAEWLAGQAAGGYVAYDP
ncbi:MAG TPA: SAM-dependent methyltransferase, partial [Actinomycetes bacterium]